MSFITLTVCRKITFSDIFVCLPCSKTFPESYERVFFPFKTLYAKSFFMLIYIVYYHYLYQLPFDLMYIHFTYLRKSFMYTSSPIGNKNLYILTSHLYFLLLSLSLRSLKKKTAMWWVHHRSIGE